MRKSSADWAAESDLGFKAVGGWFEVACRFALSEPRNGKPLPAPLIYCGVVYADGGRRTSTSFSMRFAKSAKNFTAQCSAMEVLPNSF
jgi:hypothetical protein